MYNFEKSIVWIKCRTTDNSEIVIPLDNIAYYSAPIGRNIVRIALRSGQTVEVYMSLESFTKQITEYNSDENR